MISKALAAGHCINYQGSHMTLVTVLLDSLKPSMKCQMNELKTQKDTNKQSGRKGQMWQKDTLKLVLHYALFWVAFGQKTQGNLRWG